MFTLKNILILFSKYIFKCIFLVVSKYKDPYKSMGFYLFVMIPLIVISSLFVLKYLHITFELSSKLVTSLVFLGASFIIDTIVLLVLGYDSIDASIIMTAFSAYIIENLTPVLVFLVFKY